MALKIFTGASGSRFICDDNGGFGDAVAAISRRANAPINSCAREKAAEPFLRELGKMSQKQLWDCFQAKKKTKHCPDHCHGNCRAANPPGKSTHERFNDGAAYAFWPPFFRLPVWARGIDVQIDRVKEFSDEARREGFTVTLTYPGSTDEAQHVNFRKKPKIDLWSVRPAPRGNEGPARQAGRPAAVERARPADPAPLPRSADPSEGEVHIASGGCGQSFPARPPPTAECDRRHPHDSSAPRSAASATDTSDWRAMSGMLVSPTNRVSAPRPTTRRRTGEGVADPDQFNSRERRRCLAGARRGGYVTILSLPHSDQVKNVVALVRKDQWTCVQFIHPTSGAAARAPATSSKRHLHPCVLVGPTLPTHQRRPAASAAVP